MGRTKMHLVRNKETCGTRSRDRPWLHACNRPHLTCHVNRVLSEAAELAEYDPMKPPPVDEVPHAAERKHTGQQKRSCSAQESSLHGKTLLKGTSPKNGNLSWFQYQFRATRCVGSCFGNEWARLPQVNIGGPSAQTDEKVDIMQVPRAMMSRVIGKAGATIKVAPRRPQATGKSVPQS
eukprot:197246-Amphidinium_carterae.1